MEVGNLRPHSVPPLESWFSKEDTGFLTLAAGLCRALATKVSHIPATWWLCVLLFEHREVTTSAFPSDFASKMLPRAHF